jgi:hypothetical protein
MLRYCWKRKKTKCSKRFGTKFSLLQDGVRIVDTFVKTIKNIYATLFKFLGSTEYFVEMPLDGIKSHKLLGDRDRGSSSKWRITVVSWLRREPKVLFVCRNEEGYEHAKKISGHFFNSLYTNKKHYTSLIHSV